jgi:carboxymethylenebutenolidase
MKAPMTTISKTQQLISTDGTAICAYVARPADGTPKACVIIVQEIFGVNAHIRSVADSYAERGFMAVAPCFFDRIGPNIELAYTAEDTAKGRAHVDALGMDAPMRDIRACAMQLSNGAPVAVVGFCWGGSVAMLAATRLGFAASSYYGGRNVPFLHERPQAPVMFHFGEQDPLIPAANVAKVREAYPQAHVHSYPAGHGFNRQGHADYHEASALLARERTEQFIAAHAWAAL